MDIKELSIILVSYYSYDHLKRIYNNLKNFKIIVIENSNDLKVKKFFEKKKILQFFSQIKTLDMVAETTMVLILQKRNIA